MGTSKYLYNAHIFTNADELSYYLLGLYMTDGNISKTQFAANLTLIDIDLLQSIRDLICPNKPFIQDRQYLKLSITNKIIVKWLIDNYCVPAKTFILDFPEIKSIFLPDFIRGIMDGDGTISFTPEKKNKVSCSLLCASKKFMTKLNIILKSLNYKFSFITLKAGRQRKYKNNLWNEKEYYRISFYGTNAYSFLKWIYYPENKLSLNRKNEIVKQIINYYEYTKNNFIGRELNVGCKIHWINDELLIKLVKEIGFTKAGKQLSVSDSAIRNRLKVRNLLHKIKE